MENKKTFAADFGHSLKVARIKQKIPQFELSARVGMTQNHLSRLEGGKQAPSLETAVKLAKALGVTLDELIHEN